MKILLNKKKNRKAISNTNNNNNNNKYTSFYLGDIGLFNNNLIQLVNLIIYYINLNYPITSDINDKSYNIFLKNKLNVILLGDNFYNCGVSHINDSRWIGLNSLFQHLKIPIHPVLGNHDYILNPQAQIDYTKVKNKKIDWIMDNYYYHKNIKNIDFIWIDTQILAPDYAPNININLIEKKHKKKIDILQKEHIDWLIKIFENCKGKYIIVHGHYPFYTNGNYFNCKPLIDIILPLFEKYNVKLYICGHEHNIQYLEKNIENSQYIFRQMLIGSSSYFKNILNNKKNDNVIFINQIGFSCVEYYDNEIKIIIINNNNKLLVRKNIKIF